MSPHFSSSLSTTPPMYFKAKGPLFNQKNKKAFHLQLGKDMVLKEKDQMDRTFENIGKYLVLEGVESITGLGS